MLIIVLSYYCRITSWSLKGTYTVPFKVHVCNQTKNLKKTLFIVGTWPYLIQQSNNRIFITVKTAYCLSHRKSWWKCFWPIFALKTQLLEEWSETKSGMFEPNEFQDSLFRIKNIVCCHLLQGGGGGEWLNYFPIVLSSTLESDITNNYHAHIDL